MSSETLSHMEFHPVTPQRWHDLENLFGKNGAYGNCWCMWWRMPRSQFDKQTGQQKRQALKNIVHSGEVPGLLAYADNQPIAWCSVAPREAFPVLERSRTLKRVDEQPVWSIVCFFVAKPFRQQIAERVLCKRLHAHNLLQRDESYTLTRYGQVCIYFRS